MIDGSDDTNRLPDDGEIENEEVYIDKGLMENDIPSLGSCPTPGLPLDGDDLPELVGSDPPYSGDAPGGDAISPSLAKFFKKNLETGKRRRVKASIEVWTTYLQNLATTGRIVESAMLTGVPSMTIWNWRKKFPEFDAACNEARELYRDNLLKEIHRRAVTGFAEPVFYQGKICGSIRRMSDSLLLALAKKHDPELRDGPQVQTNIGGVLIVNQPAKTEDEWIQRTNVSSTRPPTPLLPSSLAPEDPPAPTSNRPAPETPSNAP